MRSAPETLSWRSTDPVAGDQAEGEQPVGDWVDLGDLGDLGAEAPQDSTTGLRGVSSGAGPSGPATKLAWLGVVVVALGALVVPALRSPSGPAQSAQPVGDVVVRTDTHPPAYPAWVPPAPQPTLPQLMVFAAHNPRPLTDVVRSGWTRGGCPAPQPHSSSPVRRAMHSVVAAMPGFRLVDSSRLTDGFGELCLVQLRARNAAGTVVVVNVIPPQEWPGIHSAPLVTLQSSGEAGSFARTVSETTPTGWQIEIGAVGAARSRAKLPTLTDLSAVTDDPALTW